MNEPQMKHISGQTALMLTVPEGNEIVAHQWQMLQENHTVGFLPLSCLYRGDDVVLSWRVTSLQPLSLLFERQCWNVQDMMHLVRQIYRHLLRLDEMLMDERCFLADNRYIFVDPVNLSLHLAILPLKEAGSEKNTVKKLLQQWVMGECHLKDGHDSLDLLALVNALNAPDFHWQDLSRVLQVYAATGEEKEHCKVQQGYGEGQTRKPFEREPLQTRKPLEKESLQTRTTFSNVPLQEQSQFGRNSFLEQTTAGKEPFQERVPSGRKPLQERVRRWLSAQESVDPGNISLAAAEGRGASEVVVDSEETMAVSVSKRHLNFLLLQLFVIAVIIMAFQSGLFLSGGGDALMAGVGLVLMVGAVEFLAVTKFRQNDGDEVSKPLKKSDEQAVQKKTKVKEQPLQKETVVPRSPSASLGEQQFLKSTKTFENSCFSGHDETTLLQENFLCRIAYQQAEGKTVYFDVDKVPFMLGRLSGQVDVAILHPTVGKLHAELRLLDGKLALVDLNSRNGTKINGKPMAPFVPETVDVGDSFRLANETFTLLGVSHV